MWGWLSLVPSESEVVGFLISISLADLLILATSPDTNQHIERRGYSWLRRPWSGKECLILAVTVLATLKSGEINNVVCGFVFKILVMLARDNGWSYDSQVRSDVFCHPDVRCFYLTANKTAYIYITKAFDQSEPRNRLLG